MKSSLTNTLLLQKLGELSKDAIHLLMNCLFVQKHFSKSQLRLSAPRNSLSHKKAAIQFAGYTEILGITPSTTAGKCCFVSIRAVKLKVESWEGAGGNSTAIGGCLATATCFCPAQLQGLPGGKQDQAFTSVWVEGSHGHLELIASIEGSSSSESQGCNFCSHSILALQSSHNLPFATVNPGFCIPEGFMMSPYLTCSEQPTCPGMVARIGAQVCLG